MDREPNPFAFSLKKGVPFGLRDGQYPPFSPNCKAGSALSESAKCLPPKLNIERVYAARKRYWEELLASAARKRCSQAVLKQFA
jgi:hypothetical protein